MRTSWLTMLLFVAMSLAGAVAHAAPTREQLRKAEEHYEKGQTHYDLGEFDDAIAEFKAAYELSRAPALLFNIAQAYRLAKNYEQAVFFYRSYLRADPDGEARASVEQWILELEKPDQPPDPPLDKPTGVPPDVPPDEPAELPPPLRDTPRPGRGLKITGLVAGVVGVALIGVGAYSASQAASQWDEVNAAAGMGALWSPELQAKYDGAEDDERTAKILFIAGGASVAIGATLYLLGVRQASRAPQVAIVPIATGLSVGYACEF
jgi:tetratricopeptide (TPR) repeat protein